MHTLHERFRSVAAQLPDRPAVSAGADRLTYQELAALSDDITGILAKSLGADERLVALRTRRSLWAPAAILGILQSGRGYVPIDYDYPDARQQHMLKDSGAAIVITDSGLHPGEVPVASVGPFTVARKVTGDSLLDIQAGVPKDTAYVIYTSGSTGVPKGCMVAHKHVLALFEAADQVFDFGPKDVWSVFHSYSFDFNVWELWGPLLYGGRAVTVPADTATDPEAFTRVLADEGVTVLNQVPSIFSFLVRELEMFPMPLPQLRHVIFGGETLPPGEVRRWTALGIAPQAKLTNMYGITETTVLTTHCEVTPELFADAPPGTTPIGWPMPGLTVTLHDEDGAIVPDGQPGEIWVSGPTVSYGYLNRDELNRERFGMTTHQGQRKRVYRSGDDAIRRPDGRIYYLGRRDQQVKLRGFRVELGEIEAAMRSVPGIRAAACGIEVNQHGHKTLVAYLVPDLTRPPKDEDIRTFLAACLPRHMRPHRLKRLAELPVGPTGKLDRTALRTAAPTTT